jgi:hypothetical protein
LLARVSAGRCEMLPAVGSTEQAGSPSDALSHGLGGETGGTAGCGSIIAAFSRLGWRRL